MRLTISKLNVSGFEMWGISLGTKVLGSFWTENAARSRCAELLRQVHGL